MIKISAFKRVGARVLGAVFGFAALATASAQTPGVVPSPVAGEALLGEQYCFDAPWANTGSPGYGPYLRLMLPPEVDFDGAQLFGSALTVVSNAVFPASPAVLTDPLYLPATAPGNQITGTAGWRLVILELPVGSVVTNGPEMTASICVTTNNAPPNLAQIGTPYPMHVTPVYRYGASPTGTASTVGAQQSPTVTPQVLLFEKTNTAPEGERPPGSVWLYDYVLSVDIASGAMINPLVIADTLPANVQFVGPITITGGNACSATTTPSTSVPGGSVQVTCSGGTLGVGGGDDVVVSFPVHIIDILDETTCGTQLQTNTASVNASYLPPGLPAIVLPQVSDDSQVVAKHVAVQKSAAQQFGVPGTNVAYTLNLQTTQFGSTNALSVLDNLPNGVNFNVGSAQISIAGGAAVGIAPVHSGAGHPESLTFNVIAANGGAPIPPGTAIQITYTGAVLQLYETAPNAPILAADPLTNTAQATYALVEGANGCADGSAATVTIDPVEIRKELLSTGPFIPGQYVTFRLSMAIPSGDTQNVRFIDYFPLPVFDVNTIDQTYGGLDIFRATGAPAATADTMNLTPTVTVNPATNSLTLAYPNINTTQPQVVAVDIRVRVQPHAFADALFLTNIFRAQSENSDNEAAVGETPVQIQVRAPALTMTKGVLSTNGAGTIAPPATTLPVNGNLGNADAGDQVVYRLTIENIGGAPAYGVVVTDTIPAGLTSCSVAATQLASGTVLTSSGDLFTTGLTLINGTAADPVLAANDGTIGAPFGNDTAFVDVTCTIASNVLPGAGPITNTASVTWAPYHGPTCSAAPTDPACVETFPPVTDTADVGIRNVALTKSIVATSEAASTTPNVLIGEIVRYRLVVEVPEGQIPNAVVRDNLPTGMQYLNDGTARIALVGGVTASNVAGGATATMPAAPMTGAPGVAINATAEGGANAFSCTGTAFNSGTDPCFSLGNVVNAPADNDPEYIVIEFNALVLNTGNAGANRDNNFRLGSDGAQLGPVSDNVRVTLRLPSVTVGKTVTPNSGVQAGDTVTYTLTISNAAGANVVAAYDVAVNDVLPTQLQLNLPIVSAVAAGGASAFTSTSAGNTISGTIDVIPPGGSVTITYSATVLVAVAPGSSIINAVNAGWSSLPGLGTGGNGTGSTTPCPAPQATTPPGNATCERLFAGSANAPIGVTPVTLGKAVTGSSLGYTAGNDLAIGEIATFRITATIPEGTAPQVVITDELPNLMTVVGTPTVVSTGSGMTIGNPTGAPVVSGANNHIVTFNFGSVINPVGNNAPTPQTIVVEVQGRLLDDAAQSNVNGETLTNRASVNFGSGTDGTATADVDVVEPLLSINKSSPITSGQAGDTVNFTVTVQHLPTSAMEARTVQIIDTLPTPAGLNNLSVTSTALTGTGCPVAPAPVPAISDSSTAAQLDVLVEYLPLDCVLTIQYSATLMANVVVNTDVVNTANLTWHSIDPTHPDADEGRDYSDSDNHTVRISSPGMSKSVFAVNPDIGDGELGVAPDVPIGGEVTYRFTVEFPAGDSLSAQVYDQLPINAVSMQVLSSRIISVGNAISGINTTPTPVAGTPGTPVGTPTDGADADTFNDRVTWSLGDLRAAVVGNRTMEFEVVAQVMDTTETAGGVTVTNTAGFTASSIPTPITATADIDIVEPLLNIAKALTLLNGVAIDPAHIVQAGDVLTFQITLSHLAASTATAFNVDVTDLLPDPGADYIAGSVGGTCGATADAVNHPTMVFSFDALTLAQANCTITYNATVTNDVNPGTTYQNLASAAWDSLENPPAVDDGGNRRGSTGTVRDNFTILAPMLTKVVASTSLGDTAAGEHTGLDDLAIGETVTYTLTIGFPQGTTVDALLVDTLPAGLRAIGASTVPNFGNSGISTGFIAPTIAADGSSVTFDFGSIVNPADGVLTNDWISVTVTAVVLDIASNTDGGVLTNSATFSNGTSPDVADEEDVELVEPELALTKSMAAGGTGGSAVITLVIANNGTGPAYNIVLEDVLSHTAWSASSITAGTAPAGFTSAVLANTPAAGQTTVRFTSNASVGLLPDASVTATINATLAVFPPNPNPVQNTATVPSHDSIPFVPTIPGDTCEDVDTCRQYDPVDDDASLGFPNPVVSKVVANTGSGTGGAFVPGDVVIFNITVTNNGPLGADLVNATLTDVVPANTTFNAAGSHADWAPSCIDGAVAATNCALATPFTVPGNGGSVTRAFAVRIDNPLPAGVEQVANQAIMTSPSLPPDTEIPSDDPSTPADPDDPTIVPIVAAPDMVLTKVDNVAAGDVALPGDTIIYTLTYQNVGNQLATGVTITETVPANTTFVAATSTSGWVCTPNASAGSTCVLTIGDVPGASTPVDVYFAVVIDDPVAAGTTTIGNTAVVAAGPGNPADPTPDNNTDDETTPLEGTPGLQLTKTDGDVSTVPGGVVAYTLRYWNSGDLNVDNGVITETVPANTVFVPGAPSTAGWVCAPDNSAGSSCTLAVGTLIGQSTAANAASATFAVQVDDPLPAGVNAVLNAAVLGTTDPGGPETPPATDDTPVTATPDLAITKTASATSVEPGDVLVYTLSYQNIGNQGATGVVITETVPANTTFNAGGSAAGWSCVDGAPAGTVCTYNVVGEVAAGAAAVSLAFAVNIPDPIPAGMEDVDNLVSIVDDGSNGTDPNPDNNSDNENTPVDAMPALEVTKTDNNVSVAPGDAITYVINYANTGDQNATGVVLTETVPAHTTYTGAGWTCVPDASAGSSCTIAIGALAAGGNGTVNFVVTVADPIPAGVESIANVVTIHSDGEGGEPSTPPTDPTDPRIDDEETPVDALPELVVEKTDNDAVVSPGDQITYAITYRNIGNQNATGVVLTETVPAHTTYTGSGWACVPDANAGATCTHAVAGEVVAGAAAVSVAFVVTLDDPIETGVESIANRVTIHSDGDGGEPSTPPDPNDPTDPRQDEEETPVEATPDLVIVKRANTPAASPNTVVGFTLTYSNVGNQDATGVVITETVPAGTLFNDAGSTPGWSCADGSPAGTVCTFNVGPLAADGVEHEVVFAVLVLGNTGVLNRVHIEDDGSNGSDPTPPNNESEVAVGGVPVWVPAGSPWTLMLLALALGALAYRQRHRFG